MINRVIWIVLDSVGMGELPDADYFGDIGANTIAHVYASCGGLKLPNLRSLGYGNIDGMEGVLPVPNPLGAYGRLQELSNGKDTTIGHWEMIGIHTPNPFPTYPNGFPKEIIQKFIEKTGCKGILGNCVASGTTIINELGEQQLETGYPIIYTSADSVFQIAANEELIPIETLYQWCRIARKILVEEHNVARVIARPFIKENHEYVRTANRRDFSRKPSENNLLSYMKEKGMNVAAVGKIEDIFDGVGITTSIHTQDNMDGMDQTLRYMQELENGLIFTNLVEFDSKWGHRRDAQGYGSGLEAFDVRLGEILSNMKASDMLIITADHGCDPTFKGTDHTREYVPILIYSDSMRHAVNLHTGDTFANIGQTIADIFHVKNLSIGRSYKEDIL